MKPCENEPNFERSRATQLIVNCYNYTGSKIDSEFYEKSILEDSLGLLPNSWNTGLFRFLDEAIYLTKLLSYYVLAKKLGDKSAPSLVVLFHQLERNALGIRVLGQHGLDAPARQNQRTLYEICHAVCRCLIDENFESEFASQKSFNDANEFWHKNIKGQKTEKFLEQYNEGAQHKCLLVESDIFTKSYQIMGVSAHPNFVGWSIDWEKDWKDERDSSQMFGLQIDHATENLIANTTNLLLHTLHFSAPLVASDCAKIGLLRENPMFRHHSNEQTALNAIGKVSGLLFLMQAKWINRSKSDFDADIHI